MYFPKIVDQKYKFKKSKLLKSSDLKTKQNVPRINQEEIYITIMLTGFFYHIRYIVKKTKQNKKHLFYLFEFFINSLATWLCFAFFLRTFNSFNKMEYKHTTTTKHKYTLTDQAVNLTVKNYLHSHASSSNQGYQNWYECIPPKKRRKKEKEGHCHDAASKISLKMFQVKIQKIK